MAATVALTLAVAPVAAVSENTVRLQVGCRTVACWHEQHSMLCVGNSSQPITSLLQRTWLDSCS